MPTDYTPEPFDEWSDAAQERWFDMASEARSRKMARDEPLQHFYDIAMNTPKGEIRGDHRARFMEAIDGYMERKYGVRLLGPESIFDWSSWRDFYESTGAS